MCRFGRADVGELSVGDQVVAFGLDQLLFQDDEPLCRQFLVLQSGNLVLDL